MERTKLEQWICSTEGLPELTREALDGLQLQRLNETLERLFHRWGDRSPYPRRVGSLRELETLPFTTPQMLSQHPERFLLTSQSNVSRVISGATSGTSGPAKRVFYTREDTENTIGFFASGISEMLRPGETCLIAFPFTGAFGLGDLIATAVTRLGGKPIPAGNTWSWGSLLRLLEVHRPETFIGFPATLLGLGRCWGEDFPIRRALVSGDACPQGVMDALEAMLGSPLYPHYGSRECGLGGAVTCQAHQGMHLRENHILAEIVDTQGNVLPEGAWGELVITTIGLQAMPLIRYRTGDYTRFLPPCPCGGVTRRIDRTSRREGSMEALDSAIFPLPGVVDYEARLGKTLSITARVRGENLSETIQARAGSCFPGVPIQVTCQPWQPEQGPVYQAKRYLREA